MTIEDKNSKPNEDSGKALTPDNTQLSEPHLTSEGGVAKSLEVASGNDAWPNTFAVNCKKDIVSTTPLLERHPIG